MSRTVNVLFDVTFLLNFPLFCLASIRAHIILTEKYLFLYKFQRAEFTLVDFSNTVTGYE